MVTSTSSVTHSGNANSVDAWQPESTSLPDDAVFHYTSQDGDFVVFTRSVDESGKVHLTQIVTDDSGQVVDHVNMLPNGKGSVPVYQNAQGNMVEFDYLYETPKGDLLVYTGDVTEGTPPPPDSNYDRNHVNGWVSLGVSPSGSGHKAGTTGPLPQGVVFSSSKNNGSAGYQREISIIQDGKKQISRSSLRIDGKTINTTDISVTGVDGSVLVPVSWDSVSLSGNANYDLPVMQNGQPYSHYVIQKSDHGSEVFGLIADKNGNLTSVYLGSYDAVQLPPPGVYSPTSTNATGSKDKSSQSKAPILPDGDKYWDNYTVGDDNLFNLNESQSYGITGKVFKGTDQNDVIYVNQLVDESDQPLDYRIDAGGESRGRQQKDRVILPGQEDDYTKTTWSDGNGVQWTKYTHKDTGATIEIKNTESVEFRGYYGSPPAKSDNGTDLSRYSGQFDAGSKGNRGHLGRDFVVLNENQRSASTGTKKDTVSITQLITVDKNGRATPITYEVDGGSGGTKASNHDVLRLIGPQSDWQITENVSHNGSVWNKAVNKKTGTTVFYKDIENIEYQNSSYHRS